MIQGRVFCPSGSQGLPSYLAKRTRTDTAINDNEEDEVDQDEEEYEDEEEMLLENL